MEDESFDYGLADIEGVLSELPGQAEEEDEMDDIPREMLTFGTPDGLEDGPISGRIDPLERLPTFTSINRNPKITN
jgi:hypothetical protein